MGLNVWIGSFPRPFATGSLLKMWPNYGIWSQRTYAMHCRFASPLALVHFALRIKVRKMEVRRAGNSEHSRGFSGNPQCANNYASAPSPKILQFGFYPRSIYHLAGRSVTSSGCSRRKLSAIWHDQHTGWCVAKIAGRFSAGTSAQLTVFDSGVSRAGM